VSAIGQTDLGPFNLPPGATVQVSYISPGLGAEARYQLMLQGIDRAWGAPTDQRSASYLNVGPGRYRFLVRALNSDGVASLNAAGFDFEVLAPVWQRWWFLAAMFAMLGGAGYAVSRYRLSRMLQLAEMRTRIATDLHDDIGANLTRIAVLTEVVRRRRVDAPEVTDRRLASIATVARESMTAMSDIVWAIRPEADDLDELTRRMREYAEEVFAADDVELRFHVPQGATHHRLGAGVRRDLYLLFKEATNNAARHSGCTTFVVEVLVRRGRLQLLVADDGAGFEPAEATEGNGLSSMRARAVRLGADLCVTSRNGAGTVLRFDMPLARRTTSLGR
jgi:signal transduction histidine kinase